MRDLVAFEATLAPGIRGEAIEMCGTEGRLWIDRSRFEYYPKGSKKPEEIVEARTFPDVRDSLTQEHVNNFLECLRTRKRPNGDVLIGHRSADEDVRRLRTGRSALRRASPIHTQVFAAESLSGALSAIRPVSLSKNG